MLRLSLIPLSHVDLDQGWLNHGCRFQKALGGSDILLDHPQPPAQISEVLCTPVPHNTCAWLIAGVNQSTVSHHTTRLVEAGLLSREQRGKWAYCTVIPGAFEELRSFLNLG